MNFAVNVPLNTVSFGQVSTAILREMMKKGHNPVIFPIGGSVDLSSQKDDKEFVDWVKDGVDRSLKTHDRDTPIFKLWHINGSLESFSKNQLLFSFYELDQPTKEEINIVKNNTSVAFSSKECEDVFKLFGAENVSTIPLGFDNYNFHQTKKKYFSDDRITFNIVGKFEKRKHHQKMIQAWIKKFGNQKEYFLQAAIYNSFVSEEDNQKITAAMTQGQKFFNVNFFGYMTKNTLYNDFLNSADVILGMSGGEGWALPEFQSVAMGKHAVILNASAYKEWADEINSVLVNPSGKIPVYDGMFFQEGTPYNQGNIYDFNEDEFIAACEQVVERVKISRTNKDGLALQHRFTYEKTTDAILEKIKEMQ
jgi:glycosyltransferase involved in cell wall biosynthesis